MSAHQLGCQGRPGFCDLRQLDRVCGLRLGSGGRVWSRPARPPAASLYSGAMQQPMYHPDDLASMDPLVLMKNLDHVRMTSRRLSYILQSQVHLYRPEANELRMQIDQYVEAERAIESELARRQIRA